MIPAIATHQLQSGAGPTTAQHARTRAAAPEEHTPSAFVSLSDEGATLASAQGQLIAPVDTARAAQSATPASRGNVPPVVTVATAPTAAAAETAETAESPPAPISLVPNLIYAPADSDENGIISEPERRSFNLEHFPGMEEPARPPAPQVVEAELREYAAVAQSRA